MITGDQVITAITGNDTLMNIGTCPAVSVEFSRALYGHVQNDVNKAHILADADISKTLSWGGMDNYIGVWHFLVSYPAHHFVVMPWLLKGNGSETVYTVFMAYEMNGASLYSVRNYVNGNGSAPQNNPNGFKAMWRRAELIQMLRDLRANAAARTGYFGVAGTAPATTIKCWKYADIKTSTALKKAQG